MKLEDITKARICAEALEKIEQGSKALQTQRSYGRAEMRGYEVTLLMPSSGFPEACDNDRLHLTIGCDDAIEFLSRLRADVLQELAALGVELPAPKTERN